MLMPLIAFCKMKEHFTLRYNSTLDGETVMEWDLSFETSDDNILVQRLNSWLLALGKTNLVVDNTRTGSDVTSNDNDDNDDENISTKCVKINE